MDRLFSPWRSKYINSISEEDGAACVLCTAHQSHDDLRSLLLHRGKLTFALLNFYPYNSGHLMVVPYRHVGDLVDLSDEESSELIALVRKMMTVLRSVYHPDGFNVGSNIGRSSGAGIDRHVHMHVVPRWNGDTNFMPTLADTKIISEDMVDTYHKLLEALKAVR